MAAAEPRTGTEERWRRLRVATARLRRVRSRPRTRSFRGSVRTTRTSFGFSTPTQPEDYFFKSGRGLSHELVEAIAEHKDEPDWMRKFRHQALDYFFARPMPTLGRRPLGDRLRQYLLLHQADREAGRILGGPACRYQGHLGQARIPEAEKKYLAGVGAQYESEVVYHKLQEDLDRAGRDLPRHGLGAEGARGARSSSTSARSSRRTTTSSPR